MGSVNGLPDKGMCHEHNTPPRILSLLYIKRLDTNRVNQRPNGYNIYVFPFLGDRSSTSWVMGRSKALVRSPSNIRTFAFLTFPSSLLMAS